MKIYTLILALNLQLIFNNLNAVQATEEFFHLGNDRPVIRGHTKSLLYHLNGSKTSLINALESEQQDDKLIAEFEKANRIVFKESLWKPKRYEFNCQAVSEKFKEYLSSQDITEKEIFIANACYMLAGREPLKEWKKELFQIAANLAHPGAQYHMSSFALEADIDKRTDYIFVQRLKDIQKRFIPLVMFMKGLIVILDSKPI